MCNGLEAIQWYCHLCGVPQDASSIPGTPTAESSRLSLAPALLATLQTINDSPASTLSPLQMMDDNTADDNDPMPHTSNIDFSVIPDIEDNDNVQERYRHN